MKIVKIKTAIKRLREKLRVDGKSLRTTFIKKEKEIYCFIIGKNGMIESNGSLIKMIVEKNILRSGEIISK